MIRTFIGPFGALLPVTSAQPATPTPIARASSEATLLSGAVVAQRAPRASRRWTWDIPWGSLDDIGNLLALEQGVFGPPPWRWLDPMAVRVNMLPAETASPGLPGLAEWWRWLGPQETLTLAGPLTLSDGRTVAQSASAIATLELPARDSEPDPVPVIPARTYTASVQVADDTATTLQLVWVDAAGAAIGTPAGGAAAIGGRWSVTGTAPSGAAGVLVELSTDGRFAAVQLTESDVPTVWQAGAGIPRVVISGADVVYRLASAAATRRDVTVELVEVG